MRFMIIVKATAESEAGILPSAADLDRMGAYHEELAATGVLVDGNGLRASSLGWRVRYHGAQRSIVDGPFAETKELIAGFTIIRVDSREQALEWTRRFPNPTIDGRDCEIEVRQMFELEDFESVAPVERFRELGMSGAVAPDAA
jgi:hypothetical protein